MNQLLHVAARGQTWFLRAPDLDFFAPARGATPIRGQTAANAQTSHRGLRA
jgi:hypothetical protein